VVSRRLRRTVIAATAALSLLVHAAPVALAAEARSVRYVDAHSHLSEDTNPDELIAAFRKAGVGGVLIMWVDPYPLRRLADLNPGYVVPMLSISADKTILTDTTAASFVRARDGMGICGFGEFATRLLSNGGMSDAASISDLRRLKIYDAAEAAGTPVNMHVSLAEPETVAALERIVADRPHVPFILNHAGLTAGPDLLARVLATYPNVYAELSGRLTPPNAQQPRPQSALTADGALKPEWRALFERFPDRFMWGMDVQSTASAASIPSRLVTARTAFASLPQAIEENIAWRNISRVMKGCSGLPIG
jgi:hypothetical protein